MSLPTVTRDTVQKFYDWISTGEAQLLMNEAVEGQETLLHTLSTMLNNGAKAEWVVLTCLCLMQLENETQQLKEMWEDDIIEED